ncbi:MAG: hypothetical protein ACYTF7_01070 [Planctomycetota bacterium]|jgi:hypothetical protein
MRDTEQSNTIDAPRYVRTLCEHDAERLHLRRQWVIQAADAICPSGWTTARLGHGHVLCHHPEATVRSWGSEGDGVWLLGTCATDGAEGRIEFETPEQRAHESVVRALREMVGMYALVRVDADDIHCYTDPAAMMGLYYSGTCVASTPALMPELERDPRIEAQYTLEGSDDWFTGRITPFMGVRCVLANHRRSLLSGGEERFWPLEIEENSRDHQSGVRDIAAHFEGVLRRLADERPLLMSLTGGRDSRVNLAMSRDIIADAQTFTISGQGVRADDVAIPERFASRFGFPHIRVEVEEASGWITELYDSMTSGVVIGSRRRIIGACGRLATDSAVHVNGNLGAIAFGFYWDSSVPTRVRTETLLKEFINKAPCIREGVAQWQESLPDLPAHVIYNLMYLEQRGGRWMGPGETASQLFYDSFSPFCSRVFFEILAGMPISSQRGGGVLEDLVRHSWPELMEQAYCSGKNPLGRMLPKRLKSMIKRVLGGT